MEREEIPDDDFSGLFNEPVAAYGIPRTLAPVLLMQAMGSLAIEQAFAYIKRHTGVSDDTFAQWLSVNVKTFRNHRDGITPLKPAMQEHLLVLLTFVRHGVEVFGSAGAFQEWLFSSNFLLDGQRPIDLMHTNSGVRMLHDRLTNMEYGINA